jgi:RHS repeat-associated protein
LGEAREGSFIASSGERKAATYTRYPNGSVSDVQYPDGLSIHRNYTSRGQLKSVSDGRTAAPVVDYTYLPDGKVDHSILANGTRTDYGYDPRGMNSSIRTYMSSGQELWKRTYYRDDRDRIVALQRGSNNGANPMENGRGDHFWYDFEGQLTDGYYGALDPVNSPHGLLRQDHFEYDPLGNRRRNPSNQMDNLLASRGWMQFTREDNKLNQYHSWGVNSAIYDEDAGGWGSPQHANGVLMQEGHVTAGYNSLNQMVMVAGTSNWIFFGYDPLGRRVKQWTGGLTGNNLVPEPGDSTATYFYYDEWNLIQEGPSAAVATRNYIHGARVDEIVKQITFPNQWERYFHYDARGHCSLQTDAGGNIVEQYDYDAFGQPYFFDWAGTALVQYNSATLQWEGYSPWGNRFLFTGREWLSDNGASAPHNLKLYDFRNRVYQPELGRFMSPDPKHFTAGDYNLYRYCHNDPVNRNDPMGLQDEKKDEKLVREFTKEVPILGSHIPLHVTYTESGNWLNTRISDHYDPKLKSRTTNDGQTVGKGTVTQDGHDLHYDLKVNWWVDSQHANTDVVARELQHVRDFHVFSNAFANSLGPDKPLPSVSGFGPRVSDAQAASSKKYDPDRIRSDLNKLHNTDPAYYPPKPFMLPTFENTANEIGR